MPPGKINATKNCAQCNWGLNTMLGEVDVRFIALLSLFDRAKGLVRGRKRIADRKYDLDPAAWVPPGKINAMENCAHCDWEIATLSGEVNVRFIALFSLFDFKEGRFRCGKTGQQT